MLPVRMMVLWSVGQAGKMENLVKPFVLTDKQDLSQRKLPVLCLESMARNPGQSAFGLL